MSVYSTTSAGVQYLSFSGSKDLTYEYKSLLEPILVMQDVMFMLWATMLCMRVHRNESIRDWPSNYREDTSSKWQLKSGRFMKVTD